MPLLLFFIILYTHYSSYGTFRINSSFFLLVVTIPSTPLGLTPNSIVNTSCYTRTLLSMAFASLVGVSVIQDVEHQVFKLDCHLHHSGCEWHHQFSSLSSVYLWLFLWCGQFCSCLLWLPVYDSSRVLFPFGNLLYLCP